MPHTTTKNKRSKRVDTRPNEKTRRKLIRKIEDSKSIQDLRVTKVRNVDRKERVAQYTPMAKLSKKEKKLRALNKKLKSINELIERQKDGETLDEQQEMKINSLENVLADIHSLMGNIEEGHAEDEVY